MGDSALAVTAFMIGGFLLSVWIVVVMVMMMKMIICKCDRVINFD